MSIFEKQNAHHCSTVNLKMISKYVHKTYKTSCVAKSLGCA